MPFMKRLHVALITLGASLVFIALCMWLTWDHQAGKILFDTGGAFGVFSIQNFMWVAFFVGLGELYFRYQHLAGYELSLRQRYLPDDPQILLTPKDMPAIYRSMAGRRGDLENMIRSLVMRFQAGHSVDQTHAMLNSQLELWQYRIDIDYSMIRYLVWLIPTLGFLGTVVGIAMTLDPSQMDINNPELLQNLTATLGVAFYTTMVALAMSAIMVFIMHIVQGGEEQAISRSGQYCIDNLISRLYLMPENPRH